MKIMNRCLVVCLLLSTVVAANAGEVNWRELAGKVLRDYKAGDPEGHAELMKLRETDQQAFRRKVGAMMRAAVGRNPRTTAAPGIRVSDTVEVVRDVVYAEYGERKVKLDLYLPKKPPAGKLPCVMVIHGGGWRSGNKSKFARFAVAFAEKGFAVACIGYRLMPEVTVRECVQDAKASVRWVRANAGKHNIDTERIGAFGGSAGAHLAAILGTSFKEKKLEGSGGNEGVSSRVHAVVGLATPADLTGFRRLRDSLKGKAKLVSPVFYVDADSATFLLMHCKADGTVPYKQSIQLLDKLKAAKVEAELITVPSGGHAFWNGNSPVGGKALADAIEFFEKTLKKKDTEQNDTKK